MTNSFRYLRRIFLKPGLTLALLALAGACGPGAEPTPTATATAVAVATPTPTFAPGPVSSPTPTAVVPPTATPAEQPRRGGTLLIPQGGYPESFDPKLLTNALGYYEWNAKLYSNLLANYEDDKIECELCTGWRVESGGKTWVYDLIKGVKFHDGRELTAEDIKYSIELQMGFVDGIISPRGGIIKEFIDTVDAPSKYEVRINLLRPTTFQNKILGIGASAIYPKGTTRTDLQDKPRGSGPFLLTAGISGAGYTLDRNPNYFKPGLPYLDRIDIKTVADAATRTALFLTGKAKYYQGLRESTDPQNIPIYEKMAAEGKLNRKAILGGCGPDGVWFNVTKPPFTDLKIRQAFNLVAERKALDKVAMGPYGHVALMSFTPGMPYATPPEQVWDVIPGWGTGAKKQQEIEEARKLVINAGFPNGLDVVFFARSPIPSTDYGAMTEPYQQMLKGIGVRTKFQLMSGPEQQERMAKLDYTFQVYILCQSTFDPDEMVGQQWITGGARNNTGYSNPEVDKLFVQLITESDFAKKKEIFFKIQDTIVVKDVGYAPFTQSNGVGFWWKDLGGYTIGMTSWSAAGAYRADRIWLKGT